MCQQSNPAKLRFMFLIDGEIFNDEDRALFQGHADQLGEQAIKQKQPELAIMLHLNDEHVALARILAQEHDDDLTPEAKIRLFYAFQRLNDDIARVFQHRWKLSRLLPKEFER